MRVKRNESDDLQDQIDKSSYQIGDAPVEFLDSGSIMLNLAGSCRGMNGGWARGRVDNIVGDGSSGKTLMALEVAANSFHNLKKKESKLFGTVENVDITYVNVEGVMDFPVASMYGRDFYESVDWKHFDTVEKTGRHLFSKLQEYQEGTSYIYIIDSWDALDSEPEKKAFDESIDKDKELGGSYDLGKQKYASKRFFKRIAGELEGNSKDFTIFIISQTREKIGVTFGKKKYRGGGNALDFYTHQVCWLYEVGKLKRTVSGQERVYGINVRAKFERNKTSKPFREADFQILFDYGIDNVTSMVNWLYGEKAKQFDYKDSIYKRKDAFVKMIEDSDLEDHFAQLCEKRWIEIEDKIKPDRKPKF